MRRMSSRRRPESGVKHERLCEENEAKSGWSTRATVDNENQGMKKVAEKIIKLPISSQILLIF